MVPTREGVGRRCLVAVQLTKQYLLRAIETDYFTSVQFMPGVATAPAAEMQRRHEGGWSNAVGLNVVAFSIA
jgi:hypothetical protein